MAKSKSPLSAPSTFMGSQAQEGNAETNHTTGSISSFTNPHLALSRQMARHLSFSIVLLIKWLHKLFPGRHRSLMTAVGMMADLDYSIVWYQATLGRNRHWPCQCRHLCLHLHFSKCLQYLRFKSRLIWNPKAHREYWNPNWSSLIEIEGLV